MKRLEEIRIRDPFIVTYEGCYYLYGTMEEQTTRVVYVHKSIDLENWEGPSVIYTIDENSWAKNQPWAPEVHKYKGKFYLFVSMMGKDGLRGTEISVADTPEGPFIPISDRPATPVGQSCIDGTLYVEDGRPYMIYSHDWPDCYHGEEDVYIGEMWAVELSEDLTHWVDEPFMLFTSKEVPLSGKNPTHCQRNNQDVIRYGSDGPFIVKLSDGRPFLFWSPIPGGNYVVLGAVADSIRSEWKHIEPEIFADNGGHAMVFTDLSGKRYMSIHWPEIYCHEYARFIPVYEKDGRLFLE